MFCPGYRRMSDPPIDERNGRSDVPALSVVVPCFNEAGVLATSVSRLESFLHSNGFDHEVIWVDDGSSDATHEVLLKLTKELPGHRVVHYSPNIGKGNALKAGFSLCRGTWIGFMDADLAIDLAVLPKLLAALQGGADAAVASKWFPGAVVPYPAWRRALSRLNNVVGLFLVRLPFHDLQCGMKVFRRETCRDHLLAARQNGWLYDTEVLVRLRAAGLTVREVPATMTVRGARPSRLLTIRAPLSIIRDYRKIAGLRREVHRR